jgi:hypothetical protein
MAKRVRRGLRVGLGVVVAGALAPAQLATAAPHHRRNPPAAAATNGSGETLPPPPAQPETTHREGDYGGVEPDRAQPTDPSIKPKPRRVPSKGTLSWVGFELKDGGSEVFFQSPGAFDVNQRVENGQLVVELTGLTQLGVNTWRPVDTHFFDNPIARIEAHRVGAARATKSAAAHGAGIEVRISFKNVADAHEGTFRSAQESDGYFYAYLSFGTATPSASVNEPEK